MASEYPKFNDNEVDLLRKIAENSALLADAEAGDVASVAGTSGQVLANGGTAPATGAVVLSLPADITGITSIDGVAVANLVVGPATATDNGLVRFDGTTGKLVKDSPNLTFTTTSGLRLSNSVTGGLQLYNTADQTTNYERMDALWTANIGLIRTTAAGSGTIRELRLEASSTRLTISPTATINGDFRFSGPSSSSTSEAFAAFVLTKTNTSGTTNVLSITPTYNQASGNAANTDLLIQRTETAVGSGTQYLIQAGTAASPSLFTVSNVGNVKVGVTGTGTGLLVGGTVLPNSSSSGSGIFGPDGTDKVVVGYYSSVINGATVSGVNSAFGAFAPLSLNGSTVAIRIGGGAAISVGTLSQTTFAGATIMSTDTLSGAGAISVTKGVTKYTSTGASQALTLADGADGQVKRIIHDVDGGSGILTPTTKTGFSTVTFTNAGDTVTLMFVTTRGWMVLGSYGATVAP